MPAVYPDDEHQLTQEQASDALEKAQQVVAKGKQMAKQWRRSREDNNFRQMLRVIAGNQSGG